MKKVWATLLFGCFFLIISSANVGYSGTVAPPYQVGNWSGFRTAAVSYTFDDGTSNQLPIAIPILNEYGYKATLFPVINWGPNWTGLQNAANVGHEVGSHTMSHPSLGGLPIDQQRAEMVNSQNAVNSHITGQLCVTFAWPNGSIGDEGLCSQYYIASRGITGGVESNTPADFYNTHAYICGSTLAGPNTAADFNSTFNTASNAKGWCILLIHGIDGDGGYSPLASTVLRSSLQYLDARRNIFWVETFGNVVRYIKERNDVSITELSHEESSIILQVTDTLNNTIYNYPITIRRPLPASWEYAYVSQNGQQVDSNIVEVNSITYVMFNVVPDGGSVVLSESERPPGPVAPTGLTATAGDSVIWLNWNDNNEPDLAGYNLYRSTTSGSGYSKLNGSLLSDSNYIDNNVTNYTTYYYVVTAVDTNGIESGYSIQASAMPSNLTPPAAPTGLLAAAGNGIVWLDWNDSNEADFAGYNIYRSTTSGSGYSKLNTSLLTYSDY
ncbi:MAG: polysaccharide deacetylase family protein, partial [Sedimentisphaerales bacterium]